jgi:type VI secretion system (T6SS) phospholipase Tle1-like effector
LDSTPWQSTNIGAPFRRRCGRSRPLSSVEQRWFVGAHADVGGGYASDLLPQVPLRWIMKKASLHGLAFRNDVDLDGDVLKAPVTDSYREFMYGIYHRFSAPHYRPIAEAPKVVEDGTESSVNETIDASVFARWNKGATYRPPNLADWEARYQVDIANLTTSVLANNPTVSAPD